MTLEKPSMKYLRNLVTDLASASVAQVHYGVLLTGEKVAIKISDLKLNKNCLMILNTFIF